MDEKDKTIDHNMAGNKIIRFEMCIRDRALAVYSEIKTPNVYNKNVTCQLRK